MPQRLFPNRRYASGVGTKWAFFRWSDAQLPYLDRLWLVKTPWFAVCLNWINEPDQGDPHDHTSAFFSLILHGGYVERRLTDWYGVTLDRVRLVKHFNYIRGSRRDAHRILGVSRGGALTLCLMGPKTREWGYHTPNGWVRWDLYE